METLEVENRILKAEIERLQDAIHQHKGSPPRTSASVPNVQTSLFYRANREDIVPHPFAPNHHSEDSTHIVNLQEEVEHLRKTLNQFQKTKSRPHKTTQREPPRMSLRSPKKAFGSSVRLHYCERCDQLLSLGLSTRQCLKHGT